MTYELRRLRLHGLIQRVPRSHRYRLTPFGLRAALYYTRAYARILRPGLAIVWPIDTPPRSPPYAPLSMPWTGLCIAFATRKSSPPETRLLIRGS